MKKIVKQKPQDELVLEVLKKLTKRIEEATVDIHSIKFDVKETKLDVGFMQSDFAIMKVDIEKLKSDMTGMETNLGDKLVGLESRLNERIGHVADLITVELGGKLRNHEKRIKKLEQVQQTA